MLALCVLAAGASRRLGTPKALVELRPEAPATPLAMILANAAPWCDGAALVVVGAHAEEVEAALATMPGAHPELVVNPGWRAGRTSGIRLAHARRPDHDLLIAPVDVPAVESSTYRSLVRAWREAGEPPRGWLAPYRGEERKIFGHPVVCGRDLLRELSALAPDVPLRELRGRAEPLLSIRAPSDAVLEDLDTQEDLLRIRSRLRGDGAGSGRGETRR